MFMIDCPYCGSRPHKEFTYVGEARIRPDTDLHSPKGEEEQKTAHTAYVFARKNPKNWHKEVWQHSAACRAHLTLERHTLTHAIRKTEAGGVA